MVTYIPTFSGPLVELPIFDYEEFLTEGDIPSDMRLKRLFAKDIAMGYRWGDQFTEYQLLSHYREWARQMLADECIPGEQQKFCRQLFYEITADHVEQRQHDSHEAILYKAIVRKVVSHLQLWEFYNLDDDEGTSKIESQLRMWIDAFTAFRDRDSFNEISLRARRKAFNKYGHLAPPDLQVVIKKQLEEKERKNADTTAYPQLLDMRDRRWLIRARKLEKWKEDTPWLFVIHSKNPSDARVEEVHSPASKCRQI